ncbi:hypothetical protein OOU_Y34scaffold00165g9 [Pyricularia oryzae Y34]|uniref:Uncharacterized protein n=2 Tax=Pyricularia oryzae TaxID=318829 RepID=A0AA97PQF9_PYRO3|nr:hypothetical protein OOU_Y34scaffold00165g9 [Pyricularia oryzae Y34]
MPPAPNAVANSQTPAWLSPLTQRQTPPPSPSTQLELKFSSVEQELQRINKDFVQSPLQDLESTVAAFQFENLVAGIEAKAAAAEARIDHIRSDSTYFTRAWRNTHKEVTDLHIENNSLRQALNNLETRLYILEDWTFSDNSQCLQKGLFAEDNATKKGHVKHTNPQPRSSRQPRPLAGNTITSSKGNSISTADFCVLFAQLPPATSLLIADVRQPFSDLGSKTLFA